MKNNPLKNNPFEKDLHQLIEQEKGQNYPLPPGLWTRIVETLDTTVEKTPFWDRFLLPRTTRQFAVSTLCLTLIIFTSGLGISTEIMEREANRYLTEMFLEESALDNTSSYWGTF